ncbi:DUF6448 family protein [Methanobacterium spitsbergense]|uniref:DUF6448 family protein n=1 Tax=Methanobacterium spitsbergense TaxID=2874285 RepID=A0A8T5UUJ2_9EURY|nr:DUF6448 family protein [Methanobacterium spitsbergense]MBZ2164870.1 DUF6448 family protein [Methanobacterium spitsbergense]
MAPLCDTMDGPVVTAAELALEMENINYVIPYIKKEYERELRDAFDRVVIVRELSGEAAEVADYWFFETAIRLHMLGNGKSYNGIKHSSLNWGPVINKAEETIEIGDKTVLEEFLMNLIEESFENRFEDMMSKKEYDLNDVDAARDYITAMLEFIRFSHELYNHIEKTNQNFNP